MLRTNLLPPTLALVACAIFNTGASSHAEPAPFDEQRFAATVLAADLQRPLELDIAPDGRVFFIELAGHLKIYHPQSGEVSTAAQLEVFAEQEAGLIGLALDPHFADNSWVYLMHSPPTGTFVGEYVSRFVMDGDTLDRSSEKIVLKIPTHRDDCCHHAGSLEFGPRGNLFISTGDNTHPGGDSGGYAPIDERPGRHVYDAQDTAGNTADLRGKVLRIHPQPDGSYTIPEGNLFPPGGAIAGKPEIFVMGCRNPWRMNVDQRTGFVYWGEVGPDAGGEGAKGPRGFDELNQARAAGNFGWPFFIADNRPYADHDYATGKTGPLYDPEKPINRSPTNTGSQLLPKPQPAWIYYPYAASEEFPMLGKGGRTACAGPVYHFDPELDSATKLPAELDNNLFFFDWHRTFVKRVRLDEGSNIVSIESFLTEIPIKRPTDMRIGPEGALYLIDYGSTWGVNADARLLRIDYHAGNRPPVARITSETPLAGKHPFTAKFNASASSDPDPDDELSYRWSIDHDGFAEKSGTQVEFVFAEPGNYTLELEVTDKAGSSHRDSLALAIGNAPPSVRFVRPVDGGFFEWGEEIGYAIAVDDPEDGSSEDADKAEIMRSRLLLNHFIDTRAPGNDEAAYLSGAGEHAAGLGMIQASDCLNCHAVERKIVGPSFTEVAQRYAADPEQDAAVRASAQRIIEGSSKVWGEVPMLPHAQFTPEQAATIVRWIFTLADEGASDAVSQDFAGDTRVVRPAWMKNPAGALATWQVSYTDFGASGAAPLTAKAEVRLRSRQVEGEQLSRRQGTQTLGSESASGGRFIGDISHGQQLFFDHINLADIGQVTARVASPSTGGIVQLRQDKPDGQLLAELRFGATGAWETWAETSASLTDPGGIHTLCVVFLNPRGGGPFMNLDWLRFE